MDNSDGPKAAADLPLKPVETTTYTGLKRDRESPAVASSQQGTEASTPPASEDNNASSPQEGFKAAGPEIPKLPSAKRSKTDVLPILESTLQPKHPAQAAMVTDTPKETHAHAQQPQPKQPLPEYSQDAHVVHVRRASSASMSSDLSSASAATDRHQNMSPIPQAFPPAPPSTPASTGTSLFAFDGAATPLPMQSSLRNAAKLEHQQLLAEGAVTPAPQKTDHSSSRAAASPNAMLPEDFTDWAVSDRYELVRILGRGSYGEVAQAVDLQAGRPDAYVAIKRIQSPFDQQVDAVRLYREVHILRRMRGHECIIQLLDVVQPPSDDLDDFNDLYLVFECKFMLSVVVVVVCVCVCVEQAVAACV